MFQKLSEFRGASCWKIFVSSCPQNNILSYTCIPKNTCADESIDMPILQERESCWWYYEVPFTGLFVYNFSLHILYENGSKEGSLHFLLKRKKKSFSRHCSSNCAPFLNKILRTDYVQWFGFFYRKNFKSFLQSFLPILPVCVS